MWAPSPGRPQGGDARANGDAGLGAGGRKQREEEKGQRKKNYEKKRLGNGTGKRQKGRNEMQKNRVR